MFASGGSPAVAANYTWKTLSGTGLWTDSVNWSGTSATNLYPGSVGSGTADGAFIQAIYSSPPTINLDTSVQVRQLNLGGTTGATTFPVTVSTTNGSTLTLSQTTTTGTAVVAVNSAVNSGTNLFAPDILMLTTVEVRMASVTSGTVNLAIAGNVSAGSAGTKLFRYTPNNTSTTTSPSILDVRGNITNGTGGGTLGIFYRNDMPNSQNTWRLSGTGNTFSGGINLTGGGTNTILESSPASGTAGALGIGLISATTGSAATLNLGGSLSTVTEVAAINIGAGTKRIANIGAGHRILSGTVNQASGQPLALACSDAGNLTLSNVISSGAGAGGITINGTGSGKVIFSGNNTYGGATTVTQGAFQLDGVLSGSSNLSVATLGSLGGTGTASGNATIGGTISPGAASPGVLSFGSLALTSTSTAVFDLLNPGVRGTDYDGLTILNAGGLTYGGTMSFAFGGSAVPDNTTFNVFSFTGSPSGSFGQVSSTGFYAGTWTDNLNGSYSLVSGSQSLTFTQSTGDVTVTVVPEPAAIAAAGIGVALAAAAVARRRGGR
jgi:autotransporter-associated beta strand protein